MTRRKGQSQTRPQPAHESKYDWVKVKQQLEALPDIHEQLRYLDEVKTEYEQNAVRGGLMAWDFGGIYEASFGEKCDLEIRKLERELKRQKDLGLLSAKNRNSKEKRAKGGTHYQNLLALYYLLHYLRADDNATSKAKFASFLTGFSEHTFRQQWSNVHWKKDKDGVSWEDDMKIVRNFFRELGLSEVVKLIDNDLHF